MRHPVNLLRCTRPRCRRRVKVERPTVAKHGEKPPCVHATAAQQRRRDLTVGSLDRVLDGGGERRDQRDERPKHYDERRHAVALGPAPRSPARWGAPELARTARAHLMPRFRLRPSAVRSHDAEPDPTPAHACPRLPTPDSPGEVPFTGRTGSPKTAAQVR